MIRTLKLLFIIRSISKSLQRHEDNDGQVALSFAYRDLYEGEDK